MFQEVRAGPGFLLTEYDPVKLHEVLIDGSTPMQAHCKRVLLHEFVGRAWFCRVNPPILHGFARLLLICVAGFCRSMLDFQVVVSDFFQMDRASIANMNTKGFAEIRAGPGFVLTEWEPLKPRLEPISCSMVM